MPIDCVAAHPGLYQRDGIIDSTRAKSLVLLMRSLEEILYDRNGEKLHPNFPAQDKSLIRFATSPQSGQRTDNPSFFHRVYRH